MGSHVLHFPSWKVYVRCPGPARTGAAQRDQGLCPSSELRWCKSEGRTWAQGRGPWSGEKQSRQPQKSQKTAASLAMVFGGPGQELFQNGGRLELAYLTATRISFLLSVLLLSVTSHPSLCDL